MFLQAKTIEASLLLRTPPCQLGESRCARLDFGCNGASQALMYLFFASAEDCEGFVCEWVLSA
jgi:hypothetical protein